MTRQHLITQLAFLLSIVFICNLWAGSEEQSKLQRVIDRTYEKSIYAKVKVSNGTIYINRAPQSKVFAGEFFFSERPPLVAYEIVGDEGRLSVKFTKSRSKGKEEEEEDGFDINIDDLSDNLCRLDFSNKIPLSLEMDFGIIDGDLDLGGLRLEDCEITTAVSKSAIIDFKEANPIRLRRLDVENGVGKLKMLNICNANFSDFRFEAGIGSYQLDFGGQLTQDATARIEMGMGKMEIRLPRSVGVRIEVDKTFLSSLDIDDVYKSDNYYYNDNWGKTPQQLDIRIESGVGKLEVAWIE